MASLQDIRRRIKSVKSIQQITKAMKMVAAARLRRAQQAAVANKPYADKMAEIVENAAGRVGDFQHPLLEVYGGEKKLYLIIASDKGLAGAYASNIFKEVVPQIADKEQADIIAIGRKTVEYFSNRGYNIVNKYIGISERPTFEWAKKIAEDITDRYASGEYSTVYLVYSRFVSAITTVPETIQLLPFAELAEKAKAVLAKNTISANGPIAIVPTPKVERSGAKRTLNQITLKVQHEETVAAKAEAEATEAATDAAEAEAKATEAAEDAKMTADEEANRPTEVEPLGPPEPLPPLEPLEPLPEMDDEYPFEEDPFADEGEQYIFEPSADNVLGHLLPQYLITMIYGAQLQAAASELSSRMTAMSNATDNAEELIKKLDLHYNKVRQAKITSEISEIVGGAEALK